MTRLPSMLVSPICTQEAWKPSCLLTRQGRRRQSQRCETEGARKSWQSPPMAEH